jgi:hypothetical protein
MRKGGTEETGEKLGQSCGTCDLVTRENLQHFNCLFCIVHRSTVLLVAYGNTVYAFISESDVNK